MGPPFVHPLAYQMLVAEQAEEAYVRAVSRWGPNEYAGRRPLEAARLATRKAWAEAGCPVQPEGPQENHPITMLWRLFLTYGANYGDPMRPPGDWRCRECRPGSLSIQEGFRCVYHEALHLLLAAKPV